MIIVTGATGALNGATVDHLLERLPAEELVVAVRDTTKAQRFADRGVAVRHGDYALPDSLPAHSKVPTNCSSYRRAIRAPTP